VREKVGTNRGSSGGLLFSYTMYADVYLYRLSSSAHFAISSLLTGLYVNLLNAAWSVDASAVVECGVASLLGSSFGDVQAASSTMSRLWYTRVSSLVS